jgi:glycosyltransferase involved in cell wall biosynthesis
VKYSVIVPVYNRPDEVDELLDSLTRQTYSHFEVLIIEDGSTKPCEDIVKSYESKLDVRYYFKENSGQGFSRNYGFERAKGEWLIVFDSDCLIPENYFETVDKFLTEHPDVSAFGGPDKAHESFTDIQKAISYSMTSVLTTGGIRGNKNRIGAFHPRSFNMGITREVFEKTKGYILPKKGEDIEFSLRIIQQGFKAALIAEAFVYHKRRTDFRQFFRQLHFFGTARINIGRFFPGEVKWVHWFPALFMVGLVLLPLGWLLWPFLGWIFFGLYGCYFFALFLHATSTTGNVRIGFLGTMAGFIQLTAYGLGFLQEKFFSRL